MKRDIKSSAESYLRGYAAPRPATPDLLLRAAQKEYGIKDEPWLRKLAEKYSKPR